MAPPVNLRNQCSLSKTQTHSWNSLLFIRWGRKNVSVMLFAMKSLWQQGWEWVTACMHYQRNYFFQQTADSRLSAKHLTAFLTCKEYFFHYLPYCWIGENPDPFDFYVAFMLRILQTFYLKKKNEMTKKKWMFCQMHRATGINWTCELMCAPVTVRCVCVNVPPSKMIHLQD